MQTLTFKLRCILYPKLSCAYIFRVAVVFFQFHSFIQKIINDDQDDLALLIATISNFDNSFTGNCFSVHQTNDCSTAGKSRTPPEESNSTNRLRHIQRRHLSLCHLHIEIWRRRQMHIPGGPIDMTQKITHCWGDIFRPLLLCWAYHRGISE